MKQCILCKQSKFRLIASVKKTQILECLNCNLAVTSKVTGTKKTLYSSNKYYSSTTARKKVNKYVTKYERVIERASMFVSKGNALDIGGGFGLFSALLSKEKHLKVTMLEPNLRPIFLSKVKAVKWVKKSFQKFRGKKGTYSAIFFLDVLEHFPDPIGALQKAKKLLSANGYVIVLLPNYQSSMQKLSKNWPWWMAEDHYFHFTRRSLKKLLAQSDFKVEYMESFESAEDVWLSMQGNYSSIKSGLWRKVVKAVTLPIIFLPYLLLRPVLWKLYNGGLLLAIAQKK